MPEQAAALQLGNQALGDLGQVVRQRGRAQPEPGQPGGLPVLQQVGQLGGRAGEDVGVAAVLGAGQLVEALPAGRGAASVVVEEHDQVGEDVHRSARRGRRRPARRRISATISAAWRGVARGDEPDVGASGRSAGTARWRGRARRRSAGPAAAAG